MRATDINNIGGGNANTYPRCRGMKRRSVHLSELHMQPFRSLYATVYD
jgi:hypothetical protein